MKFGSGVPYIKAFKKSKGVNQNRAVHSPPGAKSPVWGPPAGWKIKVPKYIHIIYQLIAHVMYFHKDIRSICSKSTEKVPSTKIAPGDSP